MWLATSTQTQIQTQTTKANATSRGPNQKLERVRVKNVAAPVDKLPFKVQVPPYFLAPVSVFPHQVTQVPRQLPASSDIAARRLNGFAFVQARALLTLNFVSSTFTLCLAKTHPQAVDHSSNGTPRHKARSRDTMSKS